jgi:type I restriction enzyme S subunit
MAEYKPYPTYKDSKIQWLGEIPEHWEILRTKFLFKEVIERSNDGIEDLLSVSQYTGVTKKKDKVAEGELLTNASTLEGYKKVKVGDLVSNIMLAWNGSLGVSPHNGITSPAYGVYRLTNGHDPSFFNYLFRTDLYKTEFKRNSTGIIESRLRLYSDDFLNIISILPPLSEQTAIANFLDRKTSEIAGFIVLKEKTIDLLRERKTAIINKAVTKGLDDTVPMKDSGIGWLGKIPAHWEVKKLKYLIKGLVDCEHKTAPFYSDGEYLVVRTSNVKNGRLVFEDAKYTNQSGYIEWTRRGIPKPNDILLTREAPAGEACLVPDDQQVCLGQRMVWVKIKHNILNSQYCVHCIYTDLGKEFIKDISNGSTVTHLNMSEIGNIPIAKPPLEEQENILNHIQGLAMQIDLSIAQAEKEISLIKEYQQNLISEAVTGKIDVREMN